MRVFHGAFLKHELALFTGHIFPKEELKKLKLWTWSLFK